MTKSLETEPTIDMTQGFRWGRVPSERQHPTIVPDTVPASLGPLAGCETPTDACLSEANASRKSNAIPNNTSSRQAELLVIGVHATCP
jgi:hypothetical protein